MHFRVLFAAKLAAHWIADCRCDLAVSSWPLRILLRCRPPFPCEFEFILSCVYRLFRVRHRSKPVLLAEAAKTTFPEFCSLSRHQQSESTSRRVFHHSPMFRPQRFPRSRRVTPRFALQACFILQPRLGFTFQGFPRHLAGRLVDDPCPLAVSSTCLPESFQPGTNLRNPAFRALLQAAIRC